MAYLPETQTAVVPITAAQIKQLNTAPVIIIPARAGCVIKIHSSLFVYTYGTTPFGPIDSNDTIALVEGSPLTGNGFTTGFVLNVTGFLDQTQNMGMWNALTMANPISGNLPSIDLVDTPVALFQYNQNSGWPSGTNWLVGDGTMVVMVRYAYIEVTP